MRLPRGDSLTRRRRLFAYSRHSVTPRLLTMELDETGIVYALVPESVEEQFEASFEPIRLILGEAPQKLTRLDILGEWPAGFDQPSASTVWRWLDTAVSQNLVKCEGSGRKNDPPAAQLAARFREAGPAARTSPLSSARATAAGRTETPL